MVARLRLRLAHVTCEEDCGPLLVSWAIALSAAIAWLLVVYLTPAPVVPTADALGPIVGDAIVTVDPNLGYKPSPSTSVKTGAPPAVRHVPAATPLDFAGAFTAAALLRGVAEATRVIAGAETVHGDVGHPIGRADKSALGAANAAPTPGMAHLGASGSAGGGADANVGRVQSGADIQRAAFHARPLPIVTAPALDGATVDATELASFVRGRVAQLQSCYELARGTDLAGVVTLKITLGSAGSVGNAEIVRRTWSGSGAAETEGCLLRVVRGWMLPSSSEGASVTLPISFTRGG